MPKTKMPLRGDRRASASMANRGARIALSGSVVRTKKDKGYLAEMAFATKAMSLGFNVCKPMGETQGFDFTIESGLEVKKVQIKSGWVKDGCAYPVRIGGKHRPYRADETDFIIVYVVPEDAWYIVPVAAAASTRMARFFPQVGNGRGRLESYRDAWHLLGRPLRGSRRVKPVRNSGFPRNNETWL